MTADAELPLRADARRNRDQIIAAAKKIFLEFGPNQPMEEIARRAGVGVGTLYRRFPDRESLVLAVAWAIIKEDEKAQQCRDEIMYVLDDLVRRAQAEGSMRDDVGAGDVAVLISLLLRRMELGRQQSNDLVLERMLVLILDGLRASSRTPLPGRPITGHDLRHR